MHLFSEAFLDLFSNMRFIAIFCVDLLHFVSAPNIGSVL